MSDEEFGSLKRSDLLPEVQFLYDQELARRSSSPELIALHPKAEIGPQTERQRTTEVGGGFNAWLERAALKRLIVSWLVGIVLATPPWIVQTRNIDLYHNAGETANTIYLVLDMPGFIFASWVNRDHSGGSINVGAMANSVFYGFLFYLFLLRRARRGTQPTP
jgi:hypothetical protein